MNKIFSIVVCDDHPLFRAGVVNCFAEKSEFEVVSEATDGVSCIAKMELFKPDILIVDLSMPGMGGFEVLKWSTQNMPNTRVFILSMHTEINYVQQARKLGAAGFMAKEDAQAELIAALAYTTGFYTSQSIGKHAPTFNIDLADAQLIKSLRNISDAEMRVLTLLTNNLTSRQIGEELNLSARTVQAHRLSLTSKLELVGANRLLEFALLNREVINNYTRK